MRRKIVECFIILLTSWSVSGQWAVMSSRFDENYGELAVDGDPVTCAGTGLDIGPWWKLDMGAPRVVSGLAILGDMEAFQIRVGNYTKDIEDRSGFHDNPLCTFQTGHHTTEAVLYMCKLPRHGRYLSIHVVDPAYPMSIRLCEVNIL